MHDYERRLEWDTLLRKACLTDGWTEARLHATSICEGRGYLGGISLKTEYVSFQPPDVAAVRMVNRPLFFATCAATIRHRMWGRGHRKSSTDTTSRPARGGSAGCCIL